MTEPNPNPNPKRPMPRFVMIGGFLGAGKTTLIANLANRYVAAGQRVGIITNDQTENLVDTSHFASHGFHVGEVSGACFCCSFDTLVETASQMTQNALPDVLLAEPVGSCTDLVATVILPLQQMYGHQFSLAPFGVLLKPSHGRKILGRNQNCLSGFSPQAEYIFRKQLEEADYLMLGRADQLSITEKTELAHAITAVAPGVPWFAVSGTDGTGVADVLGHLESSAVAGQKVLEIDYDRYAAGEAELGWVNMIAQACKKEIVDIDLLASDLAGILADRLEQHQAEIAHLKIGVNSQGLQAIANVVCSGNGVDIGLKAGRPTNGPLRIMVNARVALSPNTLQTVCRTVVDEVAQNHGLELLEVSSHALSPSPPKPTHRLKKP